MINKTSLINEIAEKSEISKKKATEIFNTIISSIEEGLKSGEKVSIMGFLTLSTSQRAERKGRNPKTGEEITIPAKKVVRAKIGTELDRKLNS